jgi:ribosomal protein S12 methylthiotransferase accessory factor
VERGHDVLVADQTSPEQRAVGLTTVSTIVPGLIPIDFGWTMQRALSMRRLRVAPVNAGWRDTELTAEDLNMHPHPFP